MPIQTVKTIDINLPTQVQNTHGLWIPGIIKEKDLPLEKSTVHATVRTSFPEVKMESVPDLFSYPIQGKGSIFFDTVQFCYAYHHALALSPEVLGYLINYAIAIEVRTDPERYRSLFTTSPEKVLIEVEDKSLVLGGNSDWTPGLLQFEAALKDLVPSAMVADMLPSYTTETLVSRVASLICVMDAASPYYNYGMRTLCGIPRVLMLGTAEDWGKLLGSAYALQAQFPRLEAYFKELIPTLEKLVEEFRAKTPDNDFWGQIFKHLGGSGTNAFSGWLSHFVAFVAVAKRSGGEITTTYSHKTPGAQVEHGTTGSHVSQVPFKWNYYGQELMMQLAGGVLGVNVIDGALCPALSYAVLHG